ncbi:MAG: hypothetical protein V3V00_06475, partial [Saprospiraceae bacterium]
MSIIKFILIISFSFLTVVISYSQSIDPLQSSLLIDFDECNSDINGANLDYNEFTGEQDLGSSGPIIELIGNKLYRTNPSQNAHSCVLGLDFTSAMCISASSSCIYDPGSIKSVRFDIKITAPSGATVLNALSFYEASPKKFSWLGGHSGNNNYPTLFAIRVIKDGNIIYNRTDIPSTRGFSFESFDFSNNPNFEVTGSDVFNFELLAYCPVNNGASLSLWDLDDLKISARSATRLPHSIAGGPFKFCVGDGINDFISFDEIDLIGESNNNTQWIVADKNNNILSLPESFTEVNFEETNGGTCKIYHLNYSGSISGLFRGSNTNNLIGNFDLSNEIQVNRNKVAGGILSGGPFNFCVGDGLPDVILNNDLNLRSSEGSFSQWIITDTQGKILQLPLAISEVNFENAGLGTCLIWHLGYESDLVGLSVGNNVMSDFSGCNNLSNSIQVNRTEVNGGEILGGPFSFCVGDGKAGFITSDGITLSGNLGSNSQWVVTDNQGIILGLPENIDELNFENAGGGTCLIRHLSFQNGLTGLTVGNNVDNFVGCFEFSNSIIVNRSEVDGGTLIGGPFSFCVGDGEADIISSGEIIIDGEKGANSQWIVTDSEGKILELPNNFSDVDFDDANIGICLIWHLSFESGILGLSIGNNALTGLNGCYSISDSIVVIRSQVNGGDLSGGPFSFCVGDGESDIISNNAISLTDNSGSNSQWIITDDKGLILALPRNFSDIDFDDVGAGTCFIWHISFENGISGLINGNNINIDLNGCFDLSNSVAVSRIDVNGGTLTGGPFNFCVDGTIDTIASDMITLSGNSGSMTRWIVADTSGKILGLPPIFSKVDFDEAGVGICLIYHLSHEGDLIGLDMD